MDATKAEIWNIIKLSPVKSCELDPLPTWLLKGCKAELVPLITAIVYMLLLLPLVVSLYQSDPLSDTFICDIVVNHEIIKRACLS